MSKEYTTPKSKKCLNCYWYEYENVRGDDKGQCKLTASERLEHCRIEGVKKR